MNAACNPYVVALLVIVLLHLRLPVSPVWWQCLVPEPYTTKKNQCGRRLLVRFVFFYSKMWDIFLALASAQRTVGLMLFFRLKVVYLFRRIASQWLYFLFLILVYDFFCDALLCVSDILTCDLSSAIYWPVTCPHPALRWLYTFYF